MKQRTWNIAMTSTIVLLALLSLPFFAIAQDFFSGDFNDFNTGDFNDFEFGDFNDFNDGDFTDVTFGDFSSVPGDSTPGDGSTPGSDSGFDEFDDDFGPFDDTPGNPGGNDVVPDQDPDDDGCIVNCNPPARIPHSSSGGLRIFIHRIFIDDPLNQVPENNVLVRITFENDGSKDMDNTKLLLVIPDLGVRDAVGPFDFDAGEQVTKTLLLELPEDVQPGTYPVRLFVHNLLTKRIVHREIEIVDYS